MVSVLQSYDPMGPVLIRHEELSPRDESRSGTKASIVTVATLSQELFEEPCGTQNNLGRPQLSDTINASDYETSQPAAQENAASQSRDLRLSRSISVSPADDDLSNDVAIPTPTVSLHHVLPEPDRPQGSSVGSPQPVL